MVAGAKLFETTFGWNYEAALWSGSAVIVVYTFIGGFFNCELRIFIKG